MTRHAMRQERRPAREEIDETAGLWRDFLMTGIAWLIISLIAVRFTLVSVTTAGALVGMVFLLAAAGEFLFASAKVSLPMGVGCSGTSWPARPRAAPGRPAGRPRSASC